MNDYAAGGYISSTPNEDSLYVIHEGEKALNANGDVYRAERDGDGFRWVWVDNISRSENYAFMLAHVRDAVGDTG